MKHNRSGQVVAIRLLLLRDFLCANASKTRSVTRAQIEEFLESKNHSVDRRTLYSDLGILDTEFGLLLEYDEHRKGYILQNPPFEPYELRLMVDSVQSSKFITAETARTLTRKIKRLAGKDTLETLNRLSYVADRVRSMNDSVVKESDRLHQAIKEDCQIAFRYFHYSPDSRQGKTYSKNGAQYIVSPFALYWNNGNYYLYAYDGKKFRYFRVDRMERISRPLPQKREGKEEFQEKNLTNQKAKVFEMYSGPLYDVRIRFRNELAGAVIDQFGKNVMMLAADKEHFSVTVPVQISPPFFAWVASFGRRAKILSPQPVVEKMKDFLQKAADMYQDE